MKKITALVLALAILLSMTLSANAADTDVTQSGDTRNGNVSATYQPGAAGGDVIRVDIEWTGMDFTYNAASQPVWDPVNHVYSTSSEAGWATSNADITITNHSNTIVWAEIDYGANEGYSGTSMHFTDDMPYIGSAYTEENGEGTECSAVIRAVPDGELPATAAGGASIGSITVTIQAFPSSEDHTKEVFMHYYTLHDTIRQNTSTNRGQPYYASDADANAVADLFSTLTPVIMNGDLPQKNTALNSVIETFYSKLQIRQ